MHKFLENGMDLENSSPLSDSVLHGRVIKLLEAPIQSSWIEFESTEHKNIFSDFIRIGNNLDYTHLSMQTIPTLVKLSQDIAQGKQVSPILSIWIWWVQSPVSITLPAYILWWLWYMMHVYSSINKLYPNCNPRLRIHIWMSEAIEFNWFNREKTREQSFKTIYILRSFIEKYFPQMLDKVDFDYLFMDNEIRWNIDKIENSLINSEQREIQDLIAVFRKMWQKYGWHNWQSNALKYAISHIYWLQDVSHNKGLVKWYDKLINPYHISLWWKSERNFNHLRALIRARSNGDSKHHQHIHLTSDMYSKPPYYEDKDWDILFENDLIVKEKTKFLSENRQMQLAKICNFCNLSPDEYFKFVWDLNWKLTWIKDEQCQTNIKLWSVTEFELEKSKFIAWDFVNELNMNKGNALSHIQQIEEDIISRWFLPYDFEEMKSTPEGQIELIKRGTTNFIGESELLEKIKWGKKLIIKLGIDPTWDEIHIGHLIPLKKLKLFQALWYEIRFLIGTFTATIGDPDKKGTREVLSNDQIEKNIETYICQVGKIIDLNCSSAKVVYNNDWFGKWSAADLLGLAMKWKIGQMLQKQQFKERMKNEWSIAIWEFIYPLLQWWDSVILEADVELWWEDQLFNLYRWRDLQASEGQSPQSIITTLLLNGFDWKKMSKTFNNYVGIKPADNVQQKMNNDYWKLMSMDDEQMMTYFSYVVSASEDEIQRMEYILKNNLTNPIHIKKMLARCILHLFYDSENVLTAQNTFESVFSKKQAPEEIPIIEIKWTSSGHKIIDLLSCVKENDEFLSKSEIRRRIKWWAVSLNNEKVGELDIAYNFQIWDQVIIKYWKWKFISFKII